MWAQDPDGHSLALDKVITKSCRNMESRLPISGSIQPGKKI